MTHADINSLELGFEEDAVDVPDRTLLHHFPRWHLLDEASLITRVLAGDDGAFAVLVQPYLYLFTIGIHRILQDPADTQEALERAFLSMHAELNRIKDGSDFFTWAYRICLHEGLLLRQSRSCQGASNVAALRTKSLLQFSMPLVRNKTVQSNETA